MTLEVRNNIGIPLGAYAPGSGGGSGGSGGGDMSNYYTKTEIDQKLEAVDALLGEITGDKSMYVDLINEINGEG